LDDEVNKNFISYNHNPLKLLIVIIDILNKIKVKFKIAYLRCNKIAEQCELKCKKIIDSFVSPDELKIVLKQRDMFGKDLLWYVAEHNIYKILDAKVMDRILQDFWNSNIDITGRFMEASSTYQIIRKSHFAYTKDQESCRRFYHKTDVRTIRPHILQFEVWKKSMFIRYVIEAVIFIIIAGFF
jgi:hypothetical protein